MNILIIRNEIRFLSMHNIEKECSSSTISITRRTVSSSIRAPHMVGYGANLSYLGSMLSLKNNNLLLKLIRENEEITYLRVTHLFLSDSNRWKIEPNRCRRQDLQCDCFASAQSGGVTIFKGDLER